MAIFLSFWLRFNLAQIPPEYFKGALTFTLIAIPCQAIVFWAVGLYRGFWRFASLPDLNRILKSVLFGFLIIVPSHFLVFRLTNIPRSVLLLYPLFLVIGLSGPRLLYRWQKDHTLLLNSKKGKRCAVVGAGKAGELLIRDLQTHADYAPVAIIDDDPQTYDRELHGVKIVGPTEELENIIPELMIETVLIAIPSADYNFIRKVNLICKDKGITCLTLPSLREIADQQVNTGQLRPISLEDLLGRDPVQLDTYAIGQCLQNKSVLITGGGGSIGSELCRQVSQYHPQKLIIFDHSEFNLYSIEQNLKIRFPDLSCEPILGDIKDEKRVEWLFKTFSPQIIFHAAAYKHVPMLEKNQMVAVANNVFGTIAMAEAAHRFGSERFILVSTDKAVNPTNIMGTTKRIAELFCQNMNYRSKTRYITTRFGNVLGSSGSVVPIFQEQIKRGGPITVTHPDISRYFMTIPEASGLILQAGAMGAGGEIFVLDMGNPVKIKHLAEQMIALSGLEPGKDIKIAYIGLRPGEKLHEELFHDLESLQKTDHPKLLLAESRKVDWAWLEEKLGTLHHATIERDLPTIVKFLKDIVPEYHQTPSLLNRNDSSAHSNS